MKGRAPRLATIDTAFRNLIRERDRVCQYPKGFREMVHGPRCSGPLEVAHFIPRSHRSVRCNPLNAALLCHIHHAHLDRHPLDKDEWIRIYLGERWEELREADVIYRGRDAEKREELEGLKAQLKALRG